MTDRITRFVDTDTNYVNGEKVRIIATNADESVAANSARNTQSGRDASAKAKIMFPAGTEVEQVKYGFGGFGDVWQLKTW